jgi:hypothetical protein
MRWPCGPAGDNLHYPFVGMDNVSYMINCRSIYDKPVLRQVLFGAGVVNMLQAINA